jgi:ribonuclease BN (tRNA processing enzyme)
VPVAVTFLGCGDAFGSGGRFHTCILVAGGGRRILLDCGASSLIAMRRFGCDPHSVEAVLLTHLHGDHFGGLPFLLLEAHFGGRADPLVIAGPPGTRDRLTAAVDVLFPGSSSLEWNFPWTVVELEAGRPAEVGGISVVPFPVRHGIETAFALRVGVADRVVTYTGDTEWTDTLAAAARGSDLLICECTMYDRPVRGHLDLTTLLAHRRELRAERVILTHMGPEVLARACSLPFETAEDGKTVTLD